MKKVMSIIFAVVLLFSVATAEIDLSKMTLSELVLLKSEVETAIINAEEPDDSKLLCDHNGVKISIDNFSYSDESDFLRFDLQIINDSEEDIGIFLDHASSNGWEIEYNAFHASVKKHYKSKKEHIGLIYIIKYSDITSIMDPQTITMKLRVANGHSYFYIDCVLTCTGSDFWVISREYSD